MHAYCCLPESQAVKLTCTYTGKHEVWIKIQCIAVKLSLKKIPDFLLVYMFLSIHPFSPFPETNNNIWVVWGWITENGNKVQINKLLVCFVFFIVTLATNLKVTKGLLIKLPLWKFWNNYIITLNPFAPGDFVEKTFWIKSSGFLVL